jgi:hypothetical protein
MNQKPENGTSGVSKQPKREGKPTLRHVVWADLHDARRLQQLHLQAIAAALISQSECDRLRFFAAAEHAKAIGTRNPCGLFATIVRRGLWGFITQDDEDAARQVVKRIAPDFGVSVRDPGGVEIKSPPLNERPVLSRTEIRAMVASSLGESVTGVSSSGRSAAVPVDPLCAE